MAKKHLKRVAAPSSWMVDRKGRKFVARPSGSFSLKTGMPLVTVLKDLLRLVQTRKEGKRVLNSSQIAVNGIRRKDEKFMVGLMDVLTIKELSKSYRMLLDRNGVLRLVEISDSEAAIRVCRIIGKRAVRKGKIQLSLHDGRALIGSNDYRTGDSLIISLPKGEVKGHIKLETGCHAYLTGGSNIGRIGVADNISGETVTIKEDGKVFEAAKRFVFPVGKDKPVIKLDKL